MKLRVLSVQCVMLVALIGCSGNAPPTGGKVKQTNSPPANAKVGFNVGDIAPEITGVDLDGEQFALSDYRGKVVMLDFWGDW